MSDTRTILLRFVDDYDPDRIIDTVLLDVPKRFLFNEAHKAHRLHCLRLENQRLEILDRYRHEQFHHMTISREIWSHERAHRVHYTEEDEARRKTLDAPSLPEWLIQAGVAVENTSVEVVDI